jgi:uncharacterized phage infection (PIP) family protein YhgE
MSEHGIKGLQSQSIWSGLLWNSARVATAFGLGYSSYELMRRVGLSANEALNVSVGVSSGSGALLLMKLAQYGRYNSHLTKLLKESEVAPTASSDRLEAREREITRLTKEMEALTSTISSGQSASEELRVQLNTKNEEIARLTVEVGTLTANINSGQSASEQLNGQLEAKEREITQLRGEIQTLTSTISSEQSASEELKTQLREKDEEINRLKKECEELKSPISEQEPLLPLPSSSPPSPPPPPPAMGAPSINIVIARKPPAKSAEISDVSVDEQILNQIRSGIKLKSVSNGETNERFLSSRDIGDMGKILASTIQDKFKHANGVENADDDSDSSSDAWDFDTLLGELAWVEVDTVNGGKGQVPEGIIKYMGEMSYYDSQRILKLVNEHRARGEDMAPIWQHIAATMLILYKESAASISQSTMNFHPVGNHMSSFNEGAEEKLNSLFSNSEGDE